MKLSIIIPVYNAERYIERCIKSICAQGFRDFEIIVVDDGCSDESISIAQRLAEDAGISMKNIRMPGRKGPSMARKRGVDEASGEWLAFVDADDYLDPNWFEDLMMHAGDDAVDIVCGEYSQEGAGTKQTNKDRKLRGSEVICGGAALTALFNRTAIYPSACNKIYRRELLERADFPEQDMVGEDFIMVLSAVRMASGIRLTDTQGYHYDAHHGSRAFRKYDETKAAGFRAYRSLYDNYDGAPEEKEALARFIMLYAMSCLLLMYRSKVKDEDTEKEILAFIKEHRQDYIKNGFDTPAAKCFAALINPLSSKIFYRIWPGKY